MHFPAPGLAHPIARREMEPRLDLALRWAVIYDSSHQSASPEGCSTGIATSTPLLFRPSSSAPTPTSQLIRLPHLVLSGHTGKWPTAGQQWHANPAYHILRPSGWTTKQTCASAPTTSSPPSHARWSLIRPPLPIFEDSCLLADVHRTTSSPTTFQFKPRNTSL